VREGWDRGGIGMGKGWEKVREGGRRLGRVGIVV